MTFMKKCNSGKTIENHLMWTRLWCTFTGSVGAGLLMNGINAIGIICFFLGIFATMNETSKIQWQLDDLRNRKYRGKSQRPKRHRN